MRPKPTQEEILTQILSPEFQTRFWKRVHKGDGCWTWDGPATKGYGRCQVFSCRGGELGMYSHRLSWIIHHRVLIPDGMLVIHSCDNPPCVNPIHIRIGTTADNISDKMMRGRAGSACHIGTLNPNSKLTDSDVVEILSLWREGVQLRPLGDIFGVSDSTIGFIIQGTTWKHVPRN